METFSKIFNVGEVANGSRLEIDVEDYATVTVTLIGGSVAATGFAATFEASPDSVSKETGKWGAITGQRGNNPNTIESSVSGISLGVNTSEGFSRSFPVQAFRRFRIRATGITAGSVQAIVTVSKLPESFVPPVTVGISGTPTVNLGTGGTGATSLGKAEDAAAATGDTGIAVFGVRVPTTPVAQTSAAGDYGSTAITSTGKQVIAGQGAEEHSWNGKVVTNGTTDVAAQAAPGASIKLYVTDIVIANPNAANVEVLVRAGATTIMNTLVTPGTTVISLKTPLILPANTALNIALGSGTNNCHVLTAGYKDV